jgi:hypothetical protein
MTMIPSKTHRFCTVQVGNTGSGSTDFMDMWFKFAGIMCCDSAYAWTDGAGAAASAPVAWTVSQSCSRNNGANYTAGSANYWFGANGDRNYLVPAYSTYNCGRPWILFDCNGMNGTYTPQLLFDWWGTHNWIYIGQELGAASPPANTSQVGGFYFSPVGNFSAGSNTQRPWVNTEVGIGQRALVAAGGSGVYPLSSSITTSTPWTGRLHVMRSTDGAINRAIMYYNQNLMWYFDLCIPGNPFTIAGTSPAKQWNAAGVPWYGAMYFSQSLTTRAWRWNNFGSSGVAQYATTISSGINPSTNYKTALNLTAPYDLVGARFVHNASAANQGDNSWPKSTIGIKCTSSGYIQDPMGYMVDAFVASDIMADGDNDKDGTNGWITVGGGSSTTGCLGLPWDQSALVLV